MTRDQRATNEIDNHGRGQADDDRTNQQRSAERKERLPMKIIPQGETVQADPARHVTVQCPKTNLVFPEVDCGHEGQDEIMQLHADRRGYLVAFANPGYPDGEERFQAPERCKSEKDPDCNSEGNRVRRVFDCDETKMNVAQPVAKALPPTWLRCRLFRHSFA